MTVLLVDDDRDARIIYGTYLRHAGVHVVMATNGSRGIAAAEICRPDVIVMDLAMPGMDGFTAARRLKAAPRTADIPIIALTAALTSREAARAAGCDAYLAKPCLPDLLLWHVRALVTPATDAQNPNELAAI